MRNIKNLHGNRKRLFKQLNIKGIAPAAEREDKDMVKTYILEDLDCAHCAGKIEEEVGKLDGVKKSTCTLLTQKLVVDVEDNKAAGLTAEVKKIVKKFEPDVEVIEK